MQDRSRKAFCNIDNASAIDLYKLIIILCKKHTIILNPKLIQALLLSIQSQCLFSTYGLQGQNNKPIPPYKSFRERYYDLHTLCKTYSIFPDYMIYLEKAIQTYSRKNNTDIFDVIKMPDSIQQLALKFDKDKII